MQLNSGNKTQEQNHELPELKTKYTAKSVSKLISIALLSLFFMVVIALAVASTLKMDLSIDANGVLEPARVLHIHSPQSGRISNVLVNSGDLVKTDGILLELDSLVLKSKLKQLQYELNTKETNLIKKKSAIPYEKYQNAIQIEKMEASLLRSRASLKGKIVDYFPGKDPDSIRTSYVKGTHVNVDMALADLITSEAELKNSKSLNEMYDLGVLDIKNMEIEIQQLRGQIDDIKMQLREIKITSPADGVVLTEGIDQLKGTYVTEGARLLDVSPRKNWDAVLFISEKDLHKINIGNKVKVEITALKASSDYQLIHGRIISIAEEPNNNKDRYQNYSGLYRLLVSFEDYEINKIGEDKLKKGYSIVGRIITENDLIIKLILNHFKELF